MGLSCFLCNKEINGGDICTECYNEGKRNYETKFSASWKLPEPEECYTEMAEHRPSMAPRKSFNNKSEKKPSDDPLANVIAHREKEKAEREIARAAQEAYYQRNYGCSVDEYRRQHEATTDSYRRRINIPLPVIAPPTPDLDLTEDEEDVTAVDVLARLPLAPPRSPNPSNFISVMDSIQRGVPIPTPPTSMEPPPGATICAEHPPGFGSCDPPGLCDHGEKEEANLQRENPDLVCAISFDWLLDPVTLPNCGHTFNREPIQHHFEQGKKTCPSCRTPIHYDPFHLSPTFAVAEAASKVSGKPMNLSANSVTVVKNKADALKLLEKNWTKQAEQAVPILLDRLTQLCMEGKSCGYIKVPLCRRAVPIFEKMLKELGFRDFNSTETVSDKEYSFYFTF
jgi:hypothetical protein